MVVCDLCGRTGRTDKIGTVYLGLTYEPDPSEDESTDWIKSVVEISLCTDPCVNDFYLKLREFVAHVGGKG